MIFRDGPSTNKTKKERVLKISLFFGSLLLIFLVSHILRTPDPLPDVSGGVYGETFRTVHLPLQKELKFLEREKFFQESPKQNLIPVEFSEWYRSKETSAVISGTAVRSAAYRRLIRESLKKGALSGGLRLKDPLENPVPGDLFRCLENEFQEDLRREAWNSAVESLENLFCFSSIMLNSNVPDIYYLQRSVELAVAFETAAAGKSSALKSWENCRVSLPGKYTFPFQKLCERERLRMMRDFEKIRKNGIRLFDGKPELFTQLKEAFFTVSVPLAWRAVKTKLVDFFYDVDRDQTMSLESCRKILHEGCTPSMVKYPTRKMSIRMMRKLLEMENILERSLLYLRKSEKSVEESMKVPKNPLEEIGKR